MTMPDAGDPGPEFTLPDQDGNPVSLSDLRGQNVVVYFYPKADTLARCRHKRSTEHLSANSTRHVAPALTSGHDGMSWRR